jgi:hypothetical protein
MLFNDYSSVFINITKLRTLGLNISLCNLILDFLMGCPQVVRVGNNTSTRLTLNTGAPHGCVLSPLLYFLFTHESMAADHTQVVGPIPDNDETAYRKVKDLAVRCQHNNISLNISKTKELIVDYRKWKAEHSPIYINRTVVERVAGFKFLSVHITRDLSWSKHTNTVVKRGQQCIFPLRRLKKIGRLTDPQKVIQLYH